MFSKFIAINDIHISIRKGHLMLLLLLLLLQCLKLRVVHEIDSISGNIAPISINEKLELRYALMIYSRCLGDLLW